MNGAEPRGVWIGRPTQVPSAGDAFIIKFPRMPEEELLRRLPPQHGSIIANSVPELFIVIIGPPVSC